MIITINAAPKIYAEAQETSLSLEGGRFCRPQGCFQEHGRWAARDVQGTTDDHEGYGLTEWEIWRYGNRRTRLVIKDWRERKIGSARRYAPTPAVIQ